MHNIYMQPSGSHSKLLIVESPNKVKTISSYFKPTENVTVTATYGHLRSLPSKPNSIMFTQDKIDFTWIVNKQNIVNNLIKSIAMCKEIILATDCDREGEAIAWHVINIMKENNMYDNKIVSRITFQEITPKSIRLALENQTSLNINLVNAYLARLTKDYSCGFGITEKMWSKLKCGYSSAGRVQSPTLELIRAREEEITHFIQKTFFSIECNLEHNREKNLQILEAELFKINEEKINQDTIPTPEVSELFCNQIKEANNFVIEQSEIKKTKAKKVEPLKTSTLQQSANSRLHYDGKRTMRIAQSLYEGIKIDNKIIGLITYMRTDSSYLNEEFVNEAKSYILQKYGADYVDNTPQNVKKVKNAQEAHEAIRPTNVNNTPESIKQYLTPEQLNLYELIWNTAVSSLCTAAEYANLNIILINKQENNITTSFTLKKNFKSLIFEGHLCLDEKNKNQSLNENLDKLKEIYKVGQIFHISKTQSIEHKTMAPPRYNTGSLVKKMEEIGVGRPSTYVPTIDMLMKYQYCELQGNNFSLNPKGAIVSLFLQNYFSRFLKAESTNNMENILDEIANGTKQWEKEAMEFEKNLKDNINEVSKIENKVILDKMAPMFFATFNKTNKCTQCGAEELILAVRINLFFRCNKCESNFTLDSIITGAQTVHMNETYSIRKSIYGRYIENTETKKKITIPSFLDNYQFTIEDIHWLDKLPAAISNDLTLKVGKYGFYLENGTEKWAINIKDFNIIKEYKREDFLKIWESKPAAKKESTPRKKVVKRPKKTSKT